MSTYFSLLCIIRVCIQWIYWDDGFMRLCAHLSLSSSIWEFSLFHFTALSIFFFRLYYKCAELFVYFLSFVIFFCCVLKRWAHAQIAISEWAITIITVDCWLVVFHHLFSVHSISTFFFSLFRCGMAATIHFVCSAIYAFKVSVCVEIWILILSRQRQTESEERKNSGNQDNLYK